MHDETAPPARRLSRHRSDGPPRRGGWRWLAGIAWLPVLLAVAGLSVGLAQVVPVAVGRWAHDDRQACVIAYWAVAWVALVPWVWALARRDDPGRVRAAVELAAPVLCALFAVATLGGRRGSHEAATVRVARHVPDHLDAGVVADAMMVGGLVGVLGIIVGWVLALVVIEGRARRHLWWWVWAVGWPALPVGVFVAVR